MHKLKTSIIIGVFLLFIIEASCFVFFTNFQERFSFFDLRQLTLETDRLAKAKKVFNADLGWTHSYDTQFGERPLVKRYSDNLILTFGDSYTHCNQVKHNQSYQYFLSELTQRNIYNFGVGGYGTDQAYLRFQAVKDKLKAPIISLGLITENINRVVNVYRKFYYQKTALSLTKPRFLLSNNESLKLVKNPISNVDQINRLTDVSFLAGLGKHDWWFNKDRHPILQFPYSFILLNKRLWLEALASSEHDIIDDINPRPWENLWQDPEAMSLMFRIFDAFVEEVRAINSIPLIILSPRKKEVFKSFFGKALPERDIIIEYCKSKNYYCFDGITALTQRASSESELRSFFSGHLTKKGNKTFAKKLYKFLIDKELFKGPELKEHKRKS